MRLTLLLLLLLALAPGCSNTLDEPITPDNAGAQRPLRPPPPPPRRMRRPRPAPPRPRSTPASPRSSPRAFRDYKPWGRVDDELRWAPWLCRMPLPGRVRMSAAEDGGHARKLYSVFAKHRDRYPLVEGQAPVAQPVGQVLIKESYVPELVEDGAAAALLGAGATPPDVMDHFDPILRDGDRVYRASRLAGAYVCSRSRRTPPAPTRAGSTARSRPRAR